MGFFWVGALIASALVLVGGTTLLGTATGLLVNRFCPTRWARIGALVAGCAAGALVGGEYWASDVVPAGAGKNEANAGRAVWDAAWPAGLATGSAGVVVLVVVFVVDLTRGRRLIPPRSREELDALVKPCTRTDEPCFLCGRLLYSDEVEARVCRACRAPAGRK